MRKITVVALSLLSALLFAGLAYAHADYVRSDPGADAILTALPARVDIWFSQELFRRKGENVIRVIAPDGGEVSTGDTLIDDDDRRHIWVNLKPNLPAGVYQVAWQNVSLEDGHPYEGGFTFTIDPNAPTISTPTASAPTPAPIVATVTVGTTPTSVPTSAPGTGGPCGFGTAPVIGLAGYVLVKRSRQKRSTS